MPYIPAKAVLLGLVNIKANPATMTKITVLETKMAETKDQEIFMRSMVAKLLKIKAGREKKVTNLAKPFASTSEMSPVLPEMYPDKIRAKH